MRKVNGFRSGQLCDVVLIAGSSAPEERAEADIQICDERLELPAHRAVLAASSPYFFAMFTGMSFLVLVRYWIDAFCS